MFKRQQFSFIRIIVIVIILCNTQIHNPHAYHSDSIQLCKLGHISIAIFHYTIKDNEGDFHLYSVETVLVAISVYPSSCFCHIPVIYIFFFSPIAIFLLLTLFLYQYNCSFSYSPLLFASLWHFNNPPYTILSLPVYLTFVFM